MSAMTGQWWNHRMGLLCQIWMARMMIEDERQHEANLRWRCGKIEFAMGVVASDAVKDVGEAAYASFPE